MTQEPEFAQRVVLVTGGTKGIGRGIAQGFLQEGAQVVVCARTPVDELPRFGERQAEFMPCDVREADALRSLVADIVARHGRLDVLIHNAGGSPPVNAATVSGRSSGWIRSRNSAVASGTAASPNAKAVRNAGPISPSRHVPLEFETN